MKYFDFAKTTDAREAELLELPAEKRNAPMNPDPVTGVQQIADLLVCLPKEQREAAVRSMIASMLCG